MLTDTLDYKAVVSNKSTQEKIFHPISKHSIFDEILVAWKLNRETLFRVLKHIYLYFKSKLKVRRKLRKS